MGWRRGLASARPRWRAAARHRIRYLRAGQPNRRPLDWYGHGFFLCTAADIQSVDDVRNRKDGRGSRPV